MSLTTDVIEAADTLAHAIFTRLDTGAFEDFEAMLDADRLHLIQMRNDFENSGSAGTDGQKTKLGSALAKVNAMVPTKVSTNAADAAINAAAASLSGALAAVPEAASVKKATAKKAKSKKK